MNKQFWLASFAALAFASAGCQPAADYKSVDTNTDLAEKADDEHVHTAPHGGHLIELGEHKYNLEVMLDETTKDLTVYVLDAHAENPVSIAKDGILLELEEGTNEAEIALTAEPQTGDTEGMASKFVAKGNEKLKAVANYEAMHGHAHVTINGTEYEGHLGHDEHAHDDHAHDEKATTPAAGTPAAETPAAGTPATETPATPSATETPATPPAGN